MPATDDPDPHERADGQPAEQPTDDQPESVSGDEDATLTPYEVSGDVDYDRLLERFGADRITDEQLVRFPEPHVLLRRGVFYAERDLDPFLDAAAAGERHSVVTGRGPSGPMHLGHVVQFYLARHLQETTGAHVLIPVSDDEKQFLKDQSLADISGHARENLRDLLAVGFDSEKTTIVVDTADADVVYPVAAALAEHLTPATVAATYGEPPNVGLGFYPAVQAAHLLLPQLVDGRHPTLVPVAVDQDPHVRVCRDVAGKDRFEVDKPGALLSTFLPSLEGPGKMSSSDDAPAIRLDDDRAAVVEKLRTHAHSGGRSSVAEHREHGGDPEVDVAFQLLAAFLEPDDERVADLRRRYRDGDLLSGELKDLAAERAADFIAAHQERRAALGSLAEELPPYRLTAAQRRRALQRVGYPEDALAVTTPGPPR